MSALIIAAMLVVGHTNCTKKSGCEMVSGELNVTGEFHYSKNKVKIPKWPNSETMLDVNAFFVLDNAEGRFYDTIVITKASVPSEYHKYKNTCARFTQEHGITTNHDGITS